MITFRKNYGDIIRVYRKRKGLSVEKLSQISEVSVSHIRKIEESNKNINIDKLHSIITNIDIDLSFIIEVKKQSTIKLLQSHARLIRQLSENYEQKPILL